LSNQFNQAVNSTPLPEKKGQILTEQIEDTSEAIVECTDEDLEAVSGGAVMGSILAVMRNLGAAYVGFKAALKGVAATSTN
jgi:hypothetical protein